MYFYNFRIISKRSYPPSKRNKLPTWKTWSLAYKIWLHTISKHWQ